MFLSGSCLYEAIKASFLESTEEIQKGIRGHECCVIMRILEGNLACIVESIREREGSQFEEGLICTKDLGR